MGSLYYRVTLQFWDDLAIVASEHVKKGDRIFVSGRLVSDTVDEGPEKRHVYYKVSSSLVCITHPFSLSLFSLFCDNNGINGYSFSACSSTVEFHRVPASSII
jgi:single-stranded DNA-binding protein